jgi:hypothetical protein
MRPEGGLSPLSLSPVRLAALRIIECWIGYSDYRHEKKLYRAYVKRLVLEDHTRRFGEWLRDTVEDEALARILDQLPGDLRTRVAAEPTPAEWRLLIARSDLRDPLLHAVGARHEALQLTIQLAMFRPWALADIKDDENLRQKTMRAALTELGGHVSESEVDSIQAEVRDVAKELLAPTAVAKWGKRAAAFGGTAVGVAVGTAMAPGIGSAIGAKMGLSGAAAANAGLAWLGGGALSAGGYGMAGGTLLIQAATAAGATGLVIGGTTIEGGLQGLDSESLTQELAQTLTILKYVVLQESMGGDADATQRAKHELLAGLHALRDEIREEVEALGGSSDVQVQRNSRVIDRTVERANDMVSPTYG